MYDRVCVRSGFLYFADILLGAILKSIGVSAKEETDDPIVIGGNKRKTDVEVPFKSGIPAMRVSIKSYSDAGYNHVERRPLDVFCERNQIRKADQDLLEKAWLRKSHNGGKGMLIYPGEHDQVRKMFQRIEPGVSALVGNDHPQVFAIYNVDISKWHLYNMTTQVIPLLRSDNIGITSRGGNIEIGDYIVIQRLLRA